jgi:ubiquinone biosynthesis monooxygenase Coq7
MTQQTLPQRPEKTTPLSLKARIQKARHMEKCVASNALPANATAPGDETRQQMMERLVRVNQAGEYGAVRIYSGQMAVLNNPQTAPTLQHMLEQEEVHLDTFSKMMATQGTRPTVMQPFWHVAGFALGAGTALLGEKAAMACTVAVEEVIDGHYKEQADKLNPETDQDLIAIIEQFRAEELEHRDIGYDHGAEQAPAYPVLSAAIKGGSKFAIWLSTRI